MIVAGEIIKIHTYLLKAPRLRLMAGGSLLLETFSSSIVPMVAEKIDSGSESHLKAAGRFMVEFSDENTAKRFIHIIRNIGQFLFGEENVLICEPFSKDGPFPDGKTIIDFIADTLEGIKMNSTKKPHSSMTALQYMERCDACGDWGVERTVTQGKTEQVDSCHLCSVKQMARDRENIKICFPDHLKTDDWAGIVIGSSDKENMPAIPFSENPYGCKSQSFQDIAQKSSPPYIGIFYADGNDMGSIIHDNNNVNDYADISNRIKSLNDNALQAAADKVRDEKGNFPGLILVRGGDDLLAVLPGDKAIEFARIFLDKASENTSPFKEGICAGLVLSGPGMPFNMLYEKAEELLSSAKGKVWQLRKDALSEDKKLEPKDKSALDFTFLTSPLLQQLDRMPERKIYQLEAAGSKFVSLTARPYILKEYSDLIDNIIEFKKHNLPRRAFMDLKDIFRPPHSSESELEIARVDANGNFKELDQLIERLRVLYRDKEEDIKNFFNAVILQHTKWKSKDSKKNTRAAARNWQADIIELSDFL